MCERVVKIVDEGLAGCEEAEVFLGTKFKILTFVQTLEVRIDLFPDGRVATDTARSQGYGYSVSHLNSLLLTLFERYSQLLQRTFSADFEKVRPVIHAPCQTYAHEPVPSRRLWSTTTTSRWSSTTRKSLAKSSA
jgi:hypothetical protein